MRGKGWIVAVLVCCTSCTGDEADYSLSDTADLAPVATRQLDVRVVDLAPGVQSIEVDLFLAGDVTEERAVITVQEALDSIRLANPKATVLRATGLMFDFAAARDEHVPVVPVLIAEQLPVVRDTLEPRLPSDVYRTKVRFLTRLPSSTQ